MSVVAVIAVDAAEFDLGDVLTHADVRIELTQLVPIENDFVPYFWVEGDYDREPFEEKIRTDSRVEGLTRLDDAVDTALYNIEWSRELSTDRFMATLREYELLVERAVSISSRTWLFRLRSEEQRTFSEFQNTCHKSDTELTIRRIIQNPSSESSQYGVTDKQREALVVTFQNDYFSVPRQATLADLADNVGISRQAFSRRLYRALHNYLLNTGIVELEQYHEEQ